MQRRPKRVGPYCRSQLSTLFSGMYIDFSIFLILSKLSGQFFPSHDEADEDTKNNTVISGFDYVQIEYVQT